MPEVRRFLKEGHADQYDDLTVKYIPGRNPELFIFDQDNKEVRDEKNFCLLVLLFLICIKIENKS